MTHEREVLVLPNTERHQGEFAEASTQGISTVIYRNERGSWEEPGADLRAETFLCRVVLALETAPSS